MSRALLALIAAGSIFTAGNGSAVVAQDNSASQPGQQRGAASSSMKKDHASAKHDMQGGAAGRSMMSAMDKKFVMEAAMGGMAEVELGRLATERAENADVKAFGQRMIDDHTKANDELKGIAGQKGIMLPAELDLKHKAMQDQLSKLNGAAFDKAYVNMMVKDHVKDVSEFQKASTQGKDADVKGFAGKTLPTLQEHLQQVRELSGKVSGGKTMSKSASGSMK